MHAKEEKEKILIDVFPRHEINNLIEGDRATQIGLDSFHHGGVLNKVVGGEGSRVPVEVLHRVSVIIFI